MKNLGIILVVIGMVMMIITGFNYVTTKEVADIGPMEINKEENHPVRWSPIIGGILVIGGLFLLISDKKKTSF